MSTTQTEASKASDDLIQVENLSIDYNSRRTKKNSYAARAVDNISFTVAEAETLGLVGESGCGKSTTGRAILGLLDPTEGSIKFAGEETRGKKGADVLALRRGIQAVFQDPYDSLNPRMKIGNIVGEPLAIHFKLNKEVRKRRTIELLELVGLNPEVFSRTPSELSGGQRQRVSIAKALATEPKFIVCDEPVSALDVSVQAQVLNLLRKLQHELGLSYLFIGHDLSVVRYICDRIAVMYAGRLVESADSDALYDRPYHPYTVSLLQASPIPDPSVERERLDAGAESRPLTSERITNGCRFAPRCLLAAEHCYQLEPAYEEVEPGRWVACHEWRAVKAGAADSGVPSVSRASA